MKQIIYLGGKKAREYSGKPNPELYALGKHDSDYIEALMYYESYSSTLPVVDVIGDCDWKKGEVKTKGVDYTLAYKPSIASSITGGEWVEGLEIRGIVPIPKKQEGKEELALKEMIRYLPVLEALEQNPGAWIECTRGTGIATLNGYRNAINKLPKKLKYGR